MKVEIEPRDSWQPVVIKTTFHTKGELVAYLSLFNNPYLLKEFLEKRPLRVGLVTPDIDSILFLFTDQEYDRLLQMLD